MLIDMIHDWDNRANKCKGKFERTQTRVATAYIGEVSDHDLKTMQEMAVSFDTYNRLATTARKALLGDDDAITMESLRNEVKALNALTNLCAALLMRETNKVILEILTTALMNVSVRLQKLSENE